MHILRDKLQSCLRILDCDGPTYIGDMSWLNDFCAEFFVFSNTVQKCTSNQTEQNFLEIICLCLTQIIICIRHLEYTIQTESTSGKRIQASHHHFIDRIKVCLKRLCATLQHSKTENCTEGGSQSNSTEDVSFHTLLDSLLDSLSEFTRSDQDTQLMDKQQDMVLSKQIKLQIDLLLGQALSFANVALQQDKKALSALCQKVMRDCSAFQEECQPNSDSFGSNYSNQKLRAMTLEHALNQLDVHINETLLRLVFTCFLDFQKISVDKIRNVLRTESDITADEYIADFDVNLDRATQIGIFAIAFAPSLKIRTTVRSCLASFEYLDTSLIPSLQANTSDLHSELLEQHFKEELSKFKTALHEIIDSRAFVTCYLQILTAGILAAEKQFDKVQLEDLVQMGFFILEHFQLNVNQKCLLEIGQECFQNFIRILRECKAILMCASQVQPDRIIKRFKILRTILRKLHTTIATDQNEPAVIPEHNENHEVCDAMKSCTDVGNSTNLLASPSRSILYETHRDRNKGFNNKPVEKINTEALKIKAVGCLRRKQSLRTTMFKRQNAVESIKLQNTVNSQSASLEISGILDQLTCLTESFAK
ncbi:serendipity locus protein alpha [Drosophila innubila]|uniref:serendipity locus protein alpha n=1 Tax=Drosophila innubila TaxID=198719 RepID=UPI00148D5A46|nr:serendipity locus protein alpha [Drosophila innubila]